MASVSRKTALRATPREPSLSSAARLGNENFVRHFGSASLSDSSTRRLEEFCAKVGLRVCGGYH